MFRPSEIIIEAFVERLVSNHARMFPNADGQHREYLAQIARMALSRMTLTNATYTNLDQVVHTTQVAEDVLVGRIISRGDVSSADWIHFLTGALCYVIGFVRGTVPGDDGRVVVLNEEGDTFTLDKGKTDGAMWDFATDRSKYFVRHYFKQHPLIDGSFVADCIEYTRWPFVKGEKEDTDTWPGLLRGAQIVAVVSDPRFDARMKFFFMQLKDAGMDKQIKVKDGFELTQSFIYMFWDSLFPLSRDAIAYLKYTSDGLTWLANMNARMLEVEHRDTDREA